MSEQQMQGTSIEDIEMGNVKNEADSELMRQILTDMNVVEEAKASPSQIPEYQQLPPPSSQPMPPPVFQQQQFFPNQHPRMMISEYEDEQPTPRYKTIKPVIKQNKWSELFETLKEPLFVGLLVAVLLFPKLHTLGSKYAPWAYTVGGQVGWTGLFLCSIVATGVWGLYKFFAN